MLADTTASASEAPSTGSTGGPTDSSGHPPRSLFAGRARPGEAVIKFLLRLAAAVAVVTTLGIVIALIVYRR